MVSFGSECSPKLILTAMAPGKKGRRSCTIRLLLLQLLLLPHAAAVQEVGHYDSNNNPSAYNGSQNIGYSTSASSGKLSSLARSKARARRSRSLLVQEPSPAPRSDDNGDDDESCDDISDVPEELKCDFFHNTTECEEDGKAVSCYWLAMQLRSCSFLSLTFSRRDKTTLLPFARISMLTSFLLFTLSIRLFDYVRHYWIWRLVLV